MRRSVIEALHRKANPECFRAEMLVALLKPVMDDLKIIFNESKDKP